MAEVSEEEHLQAAEEVSSSSVRRRSSPIQVEVLTGPSPFFCSSDEDQNPDDQHGCHGE